MIELDAGEVIVFVDGFATLLFDYESVEADDLFCRGIGLEEHESFHVVFGLKIGSHSLVLGEEREGEGGSIH